jgi:hypothetical protein
MHYSFHTLFCLGQCLYDNFDALLCVCLFSGVATILATLPHDKCSEGMRKLCNFQTTGLNKVSYAFRIKEYNLILLHSMIIKHSSTQ